MKAGTKKVLIILILLTILIIAWHFLLSPEQNPPLPALQEARFALSEARKANAEKYVGHLLAEAQNYYDSAMIIWKRENEKWPPFRTFDSIILYANLSREKALEAKKLAVSGTEKLRTTISQEITFLEQSIRSYENKYSLFPPDPETVKNLESGKLLLAESKILFRKGEFHSGGEKLSLARSKFEKAQKRMDKRVGDYFTRLPEWKIMADEALDISKRNNTTTIIVDKYSRTCTVYKSGKSYKVFPIEMGKNWMNHKQMKGDHATPEGVYKITSKKEGARTKYYKALLINYPNEKDKQQFKKNKKKGIIPANADIGNLIEIHGGGGRGENWTSGCIALNNEHMDELFNLVSLGTPVIIIGAIEEFQADKK